MRQKVVLTLVPSIATKPKAVFKDGYQALIEGLTDISKKELIPSSSVPDQFSETLRAGLCPSSDDARAPPGCTAGVLG
eukprot:8123205-Prorocentrum_lima.AAC.1